MNLFKRFFWGHSIRNETLSLYKQGIARAERGDIRGAMDAYTLAIERLGAPGDVRSMALYNRALLLAADGSTDEALADLQAVMKMASPMDCVKLAARRRLERLRNRQTMQASRRAIT